MFHTSIINVKVCLFVWMFRCLFANHVVITDFDAIWMKVGYKLTLVIGDHLYHENVSKAPGRN